MSGLEKTSTSESEWAARERLEISADGLEIVGDKTRELSLEAGANKVVFQAAARRAGDFYHHLYQLCKGSVRCSSCDHQGRETIAAFMKDGDWIGLSETFSSLPSAVDVVVLSPLRLRAVKHRDFMALLDRYPAIIRALTREELHEAAKRHLHPERLAITVAGPPRGAATED